MIFINHFFGHILPKGTQGAESYCRPRQFYNTQAKICCQPSIMAVVILKSTEGFSMKWYMTDCVDSIDMTFLVILSLYDMKVQVGNELPGLC